MDLQKADSKEYLEFIDKFAPKMTTDDCFTPPLVYDAVRDWVCKEYGVDKDISCMTAVDNKLQQHIDSDERYRADMCRIRILRFSDELRRGVNHSEESFNNVLEDIDNYTEYCVEHEDVYINSKADAAIRNIKSVHDRCIRGDLKFL